MNLRYYCGVFGLVSLLVATAGSASGAVLSGVVKDAATGEVLSYVSVIVNGTTPAGGLVREGQSSDENGRFRFPSLPPGDYQIRFLYIGYDQVEKTVTLAPDAEVDLTIELGSVPFKMGEIVVEADRFKQERDVQPGFMTLGGDVIRDIPGIVEADPIRSLQLLPGIQAASDISSGLYIRGGSPDQTLVLLDDVPVYNPTHALGFFSTFNADAVGDVAIYKGAYPAQHAGRLSAVLDVNSRTPRKTQLAGTGGISTIAARATLEGTLGDNLWLVSARRTYLEPILSAVRTDENPLPSYYFYDLNAKLVTRGERGHWSFNGYRGSDVIGFDLSKDGDIDVDWGNTILAATYHRTIGDAFLAKVQVSGSEYESVTDAIVFGTSFGIENRLRDVTLRGDIDYAAWETHRLDGGLQWSLYDFTYENQFNRERGVAFGVTPWEFSAYVDDRWTPRDGTILRSGLRARYLSDGARYLLEPRLSASQALGDGWRVKAAGGIYHQYLQLVSTEGFSFGDYYVPIDETTEPGRSWQIVAGAEWQPTRRYRVSVEGYYTDLENLVRLDNTTPADQESFAAEDLFITGGTGYATGVELLAERRTGELTGWVGYTLGWTRRTFAEVNDGREFPPKYDRRHDVNVVASYAPGKWTYGATFVYATGQAFTPASARYGLRDPATGEVPDGGRVLASEKNSARLLPYHRLDLSVARRFQPFGIDAEWFVQVFNVYSRRNEWFVQFGEENGAVDVDVVKMLPVVPSIGINFDF